MRPSVRFEVFKRDRFTCQYCGRRPPEVVLEVDHVLPIAEGGDDDFENLTTACWDCNRGKGARLLGATTPLPDLTERTELIREREEQLRAYHAAKEEQRARRDAQFVQVWEHWFDVWRATSLPRYHTPWESSLRRYVDELGVAEVQEAMDITADKFSTVTTNAVRYFVGILKRKVAREEGRVVPCTICGKDVVLDPDQDATLRWHHVDCVKGEG